jgi:hypothetical protein
MPKEAIGMIGLTMLAMNAAAVVHDVVAVALAARLNAYDNLFLGSLQRYSLLAV